MKQLHEVLTILPGGEIKAKTPWEEPHEITNMPWDLYLQEALLKKRETGETLSRSDWELQKMKDREAK